MVGLGRTLRQFVLRADFLYRRGLGLARAPCCVENA